MELAYLDEIEQLKSALHDLEKEKRSPLLVKKLDNSEILKLEGCIERNEELINSLKEQLTASRKREMELQDLLLSAETRLECYMSDVSLICFIILLIHFLWKYW